ncbi:MAG: C39 family peptidase, partial [Candidatus Eisenbacteria bacterium]
MGITARSFLAATLVLFASLGCPGRASAVEPREAAAEASSLIERIAEQSIAYPSAPGCLPAWVGATAGEPLLVWPYGGAEPVYFIVPVTGPSAELRGYIGIDYGTASWQWYAEAPTPADPPLSLRRAVEILTRARPGSPIDAETLRLIEMPDRHFYWSPAGTDQDFFLDAWDPARLIVGQDAESAGLTRVPSDGLTRIPGDDSRPSAGAHAVAGGSHPAAAAGGSIAVAAPASRYPAEYDIVSCPHYYQTTSYHCGPASLRMVFDYWEMSIGQMMIGRVSNCTDPYGTSADDMRRAGHFSHLSTAVQDPTLHGYSQRPYGYASMDCYWSGIHYDTRYSDLKELVSSDVPILPLMWYSASHASGHFRVIKGYSDPLDVFIVHDPWFAAPYQGPNVHFQQTFFVDDLWAYAGHWAMTSQPWEFQLSVPDTVSPDDQFDLATLITYPGPLRFEDQYPALAPAATIELSGGLTLAPGETATKVIPDLYASGSAGTVQWELMAPPDSGTAIVIVRATGLISGSSGSYPYYEDEIGGVDTCRIVIRTDPGAIP